MRYQPPAGLTGRAPLPHSHKWPFNSWMKKIPSNNVTKSAGQVQTYDLYAKREQDPYPVDKGLFATWRLDWRGACCSPLFRTAWLDWGGRAGSAV